jgi:hypothetical protein
VDLGPLVDLTVGAFVDFTDDKRRFFCKSSTRRSLLTRLFAVGAFVDETVGLLVDLTVGLLVDFGPLVDLTVGAFVDFTDDRLRISCAAKAFDETAKRRATRNNWVDFIFDVWAWGVLVKAVLFKLGEFEIVRLRIKKNEARWKPRFVVTLVTRQLVCNVT